MINDDNNNKRLGYPNPISISDEQINTSNGHGENNSMTRDVRCTRLNMTCSIRL